MSNNYRYFAWIYLLDMEWICLDIFEYLPWIFFLDKSPKRYPNFQKDISKRYLFISIDIQSYPIISIDIQMG
jgi:hypothetical protein